MPHEVDTGSDSGELSASARAKAREACLRTHRNRRGRPPRHGSRSIPDRLWPP
ncbi:hypothetical protein SLI_0066 [Streptomyces lividans 1326]|uniref:Uncharacterized protein n=1 Tax=Streptomyces lividans 1326 TaxID=1200984 RepID=A0A7U9H838_STRLI|nr:hypothetical protein SLI_0066 [Streptomyces lividans 1326]